MLKIVELQIQLMDALCALPAASAVDQAWLGKVWPTLPSDWLQRFWENDKGNRASWIGVIAAAPPADKQTIGSLMAEQLRFAELYATPATVRLTDHDWSPPVFEAVKRLLVSFYAPLFYKDEGFPNEDGTFFHKDIFIDPRPKICPYTDSDIQDTKLDHFLPKDRFPMLSCHPDNLIPCSTDSNSGGHKGTRVPLDLHAVNQSASWFHPRLRSANGTYQLTFNSPPAAPQPQVQFVAATPADQPRLDNMESMFGLSDFWGRYLDDEVQNVASEVMGWLNFDGISATTANVQSRLRERARQESETIGCRSLAIVKSFFYEHIAATPTLLDQVVRICTRGT